MMQHVESATGHDTQEMTQLRAQVRKLQDIVHIAQLGYWELNLLTRTFTCSGEMNWLFARSSVKSEPDYEAFLQAIHPEDREYIRTAHQNAVGQRAPRDLIYRVVLERGAVRYIHERCHVQYVADGTALRLIGTLLDITERQRMENALRQSEQRFRGAFAHAAFGMAVVTAEGRFLEVNRSLCRMFGYSEQEMLTKDFKDLTHPDDLQKAIEFWQDLRNGRREHGLLEKRYLHKYGKTVWTILSTSVVRDARGRLDYLVSQIQDITQRKEAEEQLQQTEQWLKKTFMSLNDALFVVDTTARVVIACNPAVQRIFGYTEPEVVGRNTKFLHVDEDMYAEFGRQLYPALDAEGAFHCEFQMRRKDGSTFFSEHSVIEIVDEEGERTGAVSVVRDITARKQIETELVLHREQLEQLVEARTAELQNEIAVRERAEQDLQDAKDELEAANQQLEERVQEELKRREKQQQLLIQRSKLESLGKLAAGIAHEINQPLAGMSMGLDNISLKLASGKCTKEYLERKIGLLFQHIERIKHIIEHIRTFSRDQAAVEIEPVDVNAVCRDAVGLVQVQYKHHNVLMTLKLDEKPGVVIGNSFKLEQVLLNLLTNAKDAVDAREQRGASPSYQKRIDLMTCCDEERIYLEVQDNGIGISEDTLDNIFDPFFTTKDPARGTGLGLSVSYGIIKEMQGDIDVHSQPGAYTRMTISLRRVKRTS